MGILSPSTNGPSITLLLVCLAAVSLLVGLIVAVLGIDMPSSMGIINLFVSASIPVTGFVNHVGRAMTIPERVRFASYGTFASALMSVAVMLVLYALTSGADLFEMLTREARIMLAQIPWLVIALPLIALGVGWLVLYFASGMFSKQAVKALEMKAGK